MKHLLSSTAFLVLNKELARQVGLKEAVLLADLISKEEYFIANGMTDGWFFNTETNIEKDTKLTPFMQRKCLKTLKKHQLIEVKRIGIPAKNHFRINEQQLVKFINNLKLTKCTTINKNKEIKISNNISLRELKFTNDVSLFDYDINLKEEFCQYWCERNKSNTKMRYEMEKTFCIKRRLSRWEKNEKKWNKPKTMSKIDSQINEYLKGKEYL